LLDRVHIPGSQPHGPTLAGGYDGSCSQMLVYQPE
jgi:hypothetical protein